MKNSSFSISCLLALSFVGSIAISSFAQETSEYTSYHICTRDPAARVNLRIGPGTNYAKGLVQVGSGGAAVDNYFSSVGYSLAEGDDVAQFLYVAEVVQNQQGESWSMVGTNQWNAWVRSDFVCPTR